MTREIETHLLACGISMDYDIRRGNYGIQAAD